MASKLDSISKLSTSKKVILLLVVLGALTAVYYLLFYSSNRETLDQLTNELNQEKQKLSKSMAIYRDLQKFEEQVEKLNRELQVVRTQLPDEKEIPELLKNISSLGKESNLEFTLFRPKPEEPQPHYSKVPIELNTIGSYHNTGIFFDRVSKLPRIINVVDFNMTRAKEVKGKGGQEEVLVRTSCLLNTYRLVEKKEEKTSEKKTSQPPQSAEEGVPQPQKK
jgi:type IV pilus assembly protein PilO